MKIGNIRILGENYSDTWQRVYSKTIAASEGIDVYDKLLIHFNGSDGSTADYTAETGQTVSLEGTAQLDTAQNKFGTASLFLDGDSDYVTIPDSTNWSFGTGNFTIDCWVRFNNTAGNQYFFCQYADANNMWSLGAPNGKIEFYSIIGSVEKAYYDMNWAPSTNTWYHILFERVGISAKLFIDGVEQTLTERVAFGTNDLGNVAAALFIGATTATTGHVNGWIDEVHIAAGTARWTSNFTPPTTEYGVTSLTISNLDGNTAEEYILKVRIINGYNGAVGYGLRPNADNGTNYGSQYIQGANTVKTAARDTSTITRILIGYASALNQVTQSNSNLYAKSGYVRTCLTTRIEDVATTSVGTIVLVAFSWENTADNITSLVISADQNGGIGIGSVIELYAKRTKT